VHIQVPSPEGKTAKRTLEIADYNYSFCAQPKCYLQPNTHLKKEWSAAAKAGPRSTQTVKAPKSMELVLQTGGRVQLVVLCPQAVGAVQVRHPQA
jgi:hypothetical protein